jgi:hypothetical protein
MGIDRDGAAFLAAAKRDGVDFGSTLTIGRQNVSADESALAAAGRIAGVPPLTVRPEFAEPFLRTLGAETTDAIDASDFEDATHVHDFNEPMPDDLAGRYSAVVDGGSLEHIFDVRTSISNMMRLPRVGGHLMFISPSDGFDGHGFYQFTPEFFYRTLSAENGYAVERVLLKPLSPLAGWIAVADPASIGRRINLPPWRETMIYVLARRISDALPFAQGVPQQSDYSVAWEAGTKTAAPAAAPARRPSLAARVDALKRRMLGHPPEIDVEGLRPVEL